MNHVLWCSKFHDIKHVLWQSVLQLFFIPYEVIPSSLFGSQLLNNLQEWHRLSLMIYLATECLAASRCSFYCRHNAHCKLICQHLKNRMPTDFSQEALYIYIYIYIYNADTIQKILPPTHPRVFRTSNCKLPTNVHMKLKKASFLNLNRKDLIKIIIFRNLEAHQAT